MKNFLKIALLSILTFSVSCLKEDDGNIDVPPISGATLASGESGDPTYQNQIWIDLSSGEMTYSRRTDWDLGFYSGDEFRVILNNSIMMAAAPIEGVTELSQVNSALVEDLKQLVQVANFNPDNVQYVDDVSGDYLNNGTVISEISENDSENKVYLVNMGSDIYTGSTSPGTAYTGGISRGWKKIKILRDGDEYIIQYADLDSTTHEEYVISKNSNYNFTYFSMVNGSTVDIQPEKNNWDLGFTVFTNVIDGAGTYIYSDFFISNRLGNVGVYQFTVPEGASPSEVYENFTSSDIDETLFIYEEQRTIGANWRDVFSGSVESDRFYIIKDPNGINFKLKFLRMLDTEGYRGFFEFEYDPL